MGNSDHGTLYMMVGGDNLELRPWRYAALGWARTLRGSIRWQEEGDPKPATKQGTKTGCSDPGPWSEKLALSQTSPPNPRAGAAVGRDRTLQNTLAFWANECCQHAAAYVGPWREILTFPQHSLTPQFHTQAARARASPRMRQNAPAYVGVLGSRMLPAYGSIRGPMEREVDPPSHRASGSQRSYLRLKIVEVPKSSDLIPKQNALAPAQPSDGPADGNWVTVFGFPQGYLTQKLLKANPSNP